MSKNEARINFCKKVNWALSLIAIGTLFSLITLRGGVNVADEDTWLHLRTGEYIAQHGIPKTEVFTFTMGGRPWISHQWLWGVCLNFFKELLGPKGVVLLQEVLVVSIFAIPLLLTYKREQIFMVVPLLFLILMAHPGKSMLRPDMVSLWFILIFIGLLWTGLKRPWVIYAFFILQVIWANMHGFFIFGPLLALLFLAAEAVKRHVPLPFEWKAIGRLGDDEYRRLKMIFPLLLLACFINPQFANGFWYPIKVMLEAGEDAKFFYSFVGELQPPLTFRSLFYYLHPVYKLLIVLSSGSFLLNYRRVDLRVFLLWFIFLVFSLKASRNVLFFEFAAYMVIMLNLSQLHLPNFLRSKFWQQVQCAALAFLHIGMIMVLIYSTKKMKPEMYLNLHSLQVKRSYGSVSDQRFAHKAMDFLFYNEVKGNFFNNLGAGHRLIAHNYPNIKVYIDGRTEVFGAEFFKTYLQILNKNDQEIFQKQVEKYNITGIFLSIMSTPIPADFLRTVYSRPEWKLIYLDYDAVIFLKDIPENKAIIDRRLLDLNKWVTKPVDPRLWYYPDLAKAYRSRARTLKDIGFEEQAQQELNEALKIEAAVK